jgi:hypothetical protein
MACLPGPRPSVRNAGLPARPRPGLRAVEAAGPRSHRRDRERLVRARAAKAAGAAVLCPRRRRGAALGATRASRRGDRTRPLAGGTHARPCRIGAAMTGEPELGAACAWPRPGLGAARRPRASSRGRGRTPAPSRRGPHRGCAPPRPRSRPLAGAVRRRAYAARVAPATHPPRWPRLRPR